ncbi:MAG: hypothetical protein JXQ73_33250 [Phycisphaerae bacterium]|nr:hypothetical protein [Phycisphaerae bacterium]
MSGKRRTLWKLAVSATSLVIALILGEVLLRLYFERVTYRRTAAVDRIQRHLVLQDEIGFLWEPNISHERKIVLSWADQEKEFTTLCTDRWGFRNPPGAKKDRATGLPVNIAGVGDSFVEMAAGPFHEFFARRGQRYHSFAMHRQCTPQYNIILAKYVLPLKPDFVLYGVFENDFFELADFEAWRESGMDYFAYHSGYWCGPPYFRSKLLWPRGYLALANALTPARMEARRLQQTLGHAQERVHSDIIAANRMCQAQGAHLLVLLIPGTQTLFHGLKLAEECYDRLAHELPNDKVDVLDLRPVMRGHSDPRSLYYRKDGHWNTKGIRLAAQAIDRRLVLIRGSSSLDAMPPTTSAGGG